MFTSINYLCSSHNNNNEENTFDLLNSFKVLSQISVIGISVGVVKIMLL